MFRYAILLLLLVAASTAPAQLPVGDSTPPTARNPATAAALSTWGFLVPVGAGIALATTNVDHTESFGSIAGWSLISLGVVVGPSLGHLYAGKPAGLAFRLVIAGVGAAGLGTVDLGSAGAVILVGGAVVLVSAISDLGSARSEAERFNEQHGLHFSIVPVPDPVNHRLMIVANVHR